MSGAPGPDAGPGSGRPSNPFDALLGLRIQERSANRVVGCLPLSEALTQGSGIVHGGVYAAVVETVASIGAGQWLTTVGTGRDRVPVGLSNHTEFLRAVPVRGAGGGELVVVATPLHQGSELQLWQASVSDGRGVAAHGLVRLRNLPKPLMPPR